MPDFTTKEQLMAREAYIRVETRKNESGFKDYKTFALSFPSLIHSCGLVQAIAFAKKETKGKDTQAKSGYLDDLQKVFDTIDNGGDLLERSREAPVMEYMRITRHAINAASWIKRYCQAINTEGGGNLAELSQSS